MVSEVIASLPKTAWKRLAVVEGEKGLITSHWARVRVVESRAQLPGPDAWLLARRSPTSPDKLAYDLAYAPPRTGLATLVRVASTRYTVEQCIEEAKPEVFHCVAVTGPFARGAAGLVTVPTQEAALGTPQPLSTSCAPQTPSPSLPSVFIITVVVLKHIQIY